MIDFKQRFLIKQLFRISQKITYWHTQKNLIYFLLVKKLR